MRKTHGLRSDTEKSLNSLRIAHIVTLVSPDGSYGGPLRVANNLAAEQQRLGNEAIIVAAQVGYESAPQQIDGVRVALFRAHRVLKSAGFAGLFSLKMVYYLLTTIRRYDVVHIHMSRDLVTIPAAIIAWALRVPYVTQTHGMIDESPRRLARILDLLATRRLLRSAARCFFLTEKERSDLVAVAGPALRLEKLPNGVPSTELRADASTVDEILFLARLEKRKRPDAFVEMAAVLAQEYPAIRYTMVGPDEGMAAAVLSIVKDRGLEGIVSWVGPIAPTETAARMARANIYVLPAIDEPFPMSVLEAMSLGLPSVVTTTCGLVDSLSDKESLVVSDPAIEDLVASVRALIRDEDARVDVGMRARREASRTFSLNAVAVKLLKSLHEVLLERSRGEGVRR